MTGSTDFSDVDPTGSSGPGPDDAFRGPHAATLAVSCVGLLVATLVLAVHLVGLSVDPVRAMPWALLVVGLVLVACGVPGIVRRRRRRS